MPGRCRRYEHLLGGERVRLPITLPGNEHVWHLYVVRVANRDAVLKGLNENGIGAGSTIRCRSTAAGFRRAGPLRGALPVSERSADEILSLPIYPGITAEHQERVVEVLAKVTWRSSRSRFSTFAAFSAFSRRRSAAIAPRQRKSRPGMIANEKASNRA